MYVQGRRGLGRENQEYREGRGPSRPSHCLLSFFLNSCVQKEVSRLLQLGGMLLRTGKRSPPLTSAESCPILPGNRGSQKKIRGDGHPTEFYCRQREPKRERRENK